MVSALAGQYRLQEAFEKQEDALTLAHEAETALRATQERFKSLFRNNPVACMVQSLETRLLVDANEAYSAMYGCSRSELVGHQPPNLWADLNEHQAFRATLKAHGRVRGMHARGVRRDGSTFDSLVYAEIIEQELPDRPRGVLTGPNLAKEILAGRPAGANRPVPMVTGSTH